ncbi:MAG TPA: hypothetical protein VFO80_02605 [Sphingomonas sp.]|nr:hypothetical protein [Sphingomonas sp.]
MALICDLARMREGLRGDPKFKRIVGALDTAALAQACGADLSQSAASVAALDEMEAMPLPHSMTARIARQALLHSSILLYARATHGKGEGGRGAVQQVKSLLPAHLRQDHTDLINFRNRSVAHVHSGDTPDSWHQSYAFLVPVPGSAAWQPAMTTRSLMQNKEAIASLRRVLPAAQKILYDRFQNALNSAMEQMQTEQPDIEPFLVDPQSLLKDPEVAAALLSTQGNGTSATIFA